MWTFQSPTKGILTLEEMIADLQEEISVCTTERHRLIVGSDSQPKARSTTVTFVTAVVLHHVGKGARYYVHREQAEHIYSLRQRMFTEASYSIQVGSALSEAFQNTTNIPKLEVHLDIGEHGATKPFIRELVAWITANGYEAHIKPDSFGASKVADRYTRG